VFACRNTAAAPPPPSACCRISLRPTTAIARRDSPRPSSAKDSSPSPSEEIAQSKIEISIPLKKEDVVVSKKSFVKEEIIIKKKPVTETKTITEQLISEKVTVRNADGEEVIEEVKK